MMTGHRWCALGMMLAALGAVSRAEAAEFSVRAADGVEIHGEIDAGAGMPTPRLAVIFVAGTGLFDRDAAFGLSGTPRDLIFKDLAARMTVRGVTTVRYDVRGVRRGSPPAVDRALLAGRTTASMRDDLGAIYRWARAPDGLGAVCVGFFAHSEGMLHVARLAEQGEAAPALVIGMGAAMASPRATLLWQMTERDAFSLERMDGNGDGTTTNDEVRAGIARTPSGVHGVVEPYLHPSGAWKAEDLVTLRTTQLANYTKFREQVLAQDDDTPFPDKDNAMASHEWWKSWFLDERTAAERLARWGTTFSLHYGDKDSQTAPVPQLVAARAHLPAGKLKAHIHPDRGHTLGSDVLFGPVDPTIADQIADETAAAAAICAPG